MNVAAAIGMMSLAVNVAMGVMFAAFGMARGWRVARVFAAIALSGALYTLTGLLLSAPDMPAWALMIAARGAYVAGTMHTVAWVVYAFGDAEGRIASVPRALRWASGAILGAVAVLTVTGAHLQSEVVVVAIPWAGVSYHYPLTTPLGDVFGLLPPALLGVVFGQLVRRQRAGEDDLRLHLVGFAVFFGCALEEVLVANRVVEFLSLADVGTVIVVLPLSVLVARRVTADAERLTLRSAGLEEEVRRRTEERDDARARLVESERLAALGRLAAGVGHEVNNPLAYLLLALDEAGSPDPAVARQALADAKDGASRIQRVVEGLRGYSRRPTDPAPLHPHDIVRAALRVAGPQVRHLGALALHLDPVPRVLGQEPRLVQALINLIVNAAQAVEPPHPAGRIALRTTRGADGEAVIVVADNGPGIPADHLRRLSEPYFTTRASSGGLGLGLFITRSIVESHGGRLEFVSRAGEGTEVRVHLPGLPAEMAAAEAPPPAPAPTAPGKRGRLLIVDDEPMLLRLLGRVLGSTWSITTATSGEEALARIE